MQLFIHPASPNCIAVLALADMAGLKLDVQHIDLFRGEHRSQAYLSINPNGLVPVLQDDDFILWETVAIMEYLCSKDPLHRLLSADPRRRADVLRWMTWGLAAWVPSLQVFIYERMFKSIKNLGEADTQRLVAEQPKLDKVATILDAQLSRSPYVCGDAVSAADLYLAAYPVYAGLAGIDLQPYKHLSDWLRRVHGLPEWQRASEGRAIPAGSSS